MSAAAGCADLARHSAALVEEEAWITVEVCARCAWPCRDACDSQEWTSQECLAMHHRSSANDHKVINIQWLS